MKKLKKGIVLMTTFVILTSSMMVFAKAYTNKYVYGEKYVVVADGESTNAASYLAVTVDEIYKSDGTDSNYSKVKADVLSNAGNQISVSTDNVLRKGEVVNIPLLIFYGAGADMKLRMKGNVSSLDCIVDFTAAID